MVIILLLLTKVNTMSTIENKLPPSLVPSQRLVNPDALKFTQALLSNDARLALNPDGKSELVFRFDDFLGGLQIKSVQLPENQLGVVFLVKGKPISRKEFTEGVTKGGAELLSNMLVLVGGDITKLSQAPSLAHLGLSAKPEDMQLNAYKIGLMALKRTGITRQPDGTVVSDSEINPSADLHEPDENALSELNMDLSLRDATAANKAGSSAATPGAAPSGGLSAAKSKTLQDMLNNPASAQLTPQRFSAILTETGLVPNDPKISWLQDPTKSISPEEMKAVLTRAGSAFSQLVQADAEAPNNIKDLAKHYAQPMAFGAFTQQVMKDLRTLALVVSPDQTSSINSAPDIGILVGVRAITDLPQQPGQTDQQSGQSQPSGQPAQSGQKPPTPASPVASAFGSIIQLLGSYLNRKAQQQQYPQLNPLGYSQMDPAALAQQQYLLMQQQAALNGGLLPQQINPALAQQAAYQQLLLQQQQAALSGRFNPLINYTGGLNPAALNRSMTIDPRLLGLV
jgi:hypothetical protein